MHGFADDIATGRTPEKLRIVGRPAVGHEERYIALEEPSEPVQMHWLKDNLMPHFRKNCPYCAADSEDIRPLWYLGVCTLEKQLAILELSATCFRTLSAAAGTVRGAGYVGLFVKIFRPRGRHSPRILRCEQRVETAKHPWPYQTRHELARIWGVPLRPRLYEVGNA